MVGAGIVGASVAYHAARRGAAVTVVESALPGCGVTGSSFAWIGASGVAPGPAAALRRAATDEYRRLQSELPDLRVSWTGSLSWSSGPPPARVDDAQRLVGADAVAALEPNLREPPPWAVHTPGDGAVDPVAVTEALVDGARRHGARVLVGTSVASVVVTAGRTVGVRTSTGDTLGARTVVVATGAEVSHLCAPLGFAVPVSRSPAILCRLGGAERLVRHVVAGPRVEVRPAGDGTLLAALDHAGETSIDQVTRRGHRAVADIASLFRGGESVHLRSAHIAWRPMPVDGEPVIGRVPDVAGLYLAVLHSGVSLAAVVGRLVAEEVVDDVDPVDLRGCRPGRFVRSPPTGG